MKVKELIEQLQRLEQDRNIWVVWESARPPRIVIEEDGFMDEYGRGGEVKKGDYTIEQLTELNP